LFTSAHDALYLIPSVRGVRALGGRKDYKNKVVVRDLSRSPALHGPRATSEPSRGIPILAPIISLGGPLGLRLVARLGTLSLTARAGLSP